MNLIADKQKRAKQQIEHEKATAAWDAAGKRSPVSGLGERVWSAKHSEARPNATERRRAGMVAIRARLKKAYDANKLRFEWPKDESRYWPHQNVREMARRERQRLSLKIQHRDNKAMEIGRAFSARYRQTMAALAK